MDDLDFLSTVLFLVLSPLCVFVVHALCSWVCHLTGRQISNQKVALLAIAISIVVQNVVFLTVTRLELNSALLFYVLCYTSCVGYSYFHLFNMSETARRIKIIVGVWQKKIRATSDLSCFYNEGQMLEVRMKRLEEINQVKVDNGYYIVKGRSLLLAAGVMRFFKVLLRLD